MYSRRLLFNNEVDYSLFSAGISLPNKLNYIFGQTGYGCMLREGKTKDIIIYLDGDIYNAEVINTDYNDEIELNRLKITYSENSDLYNKFKILYKFSYEDYLYRRKGKKYFSTRPLNGGKEYISIYAIKNNYTAKHLDSYYVEASYKKIFNDCIIAGKNQINTYFELFRDMGELIYDINSNQRKKDNWRSYIIKFHEIWRKQDKNNLLNFGGKYIWGKKVQVASDKKIEDVFNRNIDSNIVEFLHMKGKNCIEEIEDVDLIQLIFHRNIEFIDFKRTINNLFTKNKNIEETEMNSNIMIDIEENKTIFTSGDAADLVNKIKSELDTFPDITNYFNTEITRLNNIIGSRDTAITQLNNKINLQNQEIIMLRNTVKELEEMNTSMQYSEELEMVKENLKEIKSLLEKDNIL